MESVMPIINFLVAVTLGFAILVSTGIILLAGWSLAHGRRIDPIDLGVIIVVFWLIPIAIRAFAPSVLWAMVDSWQNSEEPAAILQSEIQDWVMSGINKNDDGDGAVVSNDVTAVHPTATPLPEPTQAQATAVPATPLTTATSTPVPTAIITAVDPDADVPAIATQNAELINNPPTPTVFLCRDTGDFEQFRADVEAGCVPPRGK